MKMAINKRMNNPTDKYQNTLIQLKLRKMNKELKQSYKISNMAFKRREQTQHKLEEEIENLKIIERKLKKLKQ